MAVGISGVVSRLVAPLKFGKIRLIWRHFPGGQINEVDAGSTTFGFIAVIRHDSDVPSVWRHIKTMKLNGIEVRETAESFVWIHFVDIADEMPQGFIRRIIVVPHRDEHSIGLGGNVQRLDFFYLLPG